MNASPQAITRSRGLAVLALIGTVALGLRLYLFGGYVGLDDAEYGRLAYLMSQGRFPLGEYAGPAAFPIRIAPIAFTALLVRFAGLSEWVMACFPLFLSLASIPLVYLFASTLFGRGAGLLAAAILAILPIDIQNATVLVPDLPAAVLAAAGVAVIVYLSHLDGERGRLWFFGGLGAGLLFGLSWLTKESIAYLAPFVLLLMIVTVKGRGRAFLAVWVGATIGAVGTVCVEMAVYHALTGDALFRFHEVERNYQQLKNGFFTEGSDFGWREGESRSTAIMRRLLVTGPRFLLWNPANSYLPLLGLVGALFGLIRRERAFLVPSLWLAVLLFMFNFASTSTSTYTPLPLFNRYLFPLFFPAAALAGGLVAWQLGPALQSIRDRKVPIRYWSVFLASGVVLWAGVRPLVWALRDPNPHWWTSEVRELSDQIRPETVLYSDTLTLRGLNFFEGYPGPNRWVDFQRIESASDVEPTSLVLINPQYLRWLELNRGMWLSKLEGYRIHPFFESPPSHWTKVWENGNASLYEVGSPPG